MERCTTCGRPQNEHRLFGHRFRPSLSVTRPSYEPAADYSGIFDAYADYSSSSSDCSPGSSDSGCDSGGGGDGGCGGE